VAAARPAVPTNSRSTLANDLVSIRTVIAFMRLGAGRVQLGRFPVIRAIIDPRNLKILSREVS
jgi:hypothetical protein